jgi:hypothetical protein
MKDIGNCPLCGNIYGKNNHKTFHHCFPVNVFPNSQLKVEVCQKCHGEFNKLYEHTEKLDRPTWLKRWILFVISKKKKPYEIYPQLRDF